MRPVWVVVEVQDLTAAAQEVTTLVWQARQIQGMSGCLGEETGPLEIILAGRSISQFSTKTQERFGLPVTALDLPREAAWDTLSQALSDLGAVQKPWLALFAHTTMAREVGPVLALRLGGAALANVSDVRIQGQHLVCQRPVMDNTQVQEVRVPRSFPLVLTLAPGAGSCGETCQPQNPGNALGHGPDPWRDSPVGSGPGGLPGKSAVTDLQLAIPRTSTLRRKELRSRAGGSSRGLSQARVVVAAGRGIGEKENLEMVEAFAAALPGAVTAASRPLVDQGWVAYPKQVGITGATVAPELYIALGISGSSQHLAGMSGARWVVSINSNPNAPICRHSDLCIQAEALAFIQAYLDQNQGSR